MEVLSLVLLLAVAVALPFDSTGASNSLSFGETAAVQTRSKLSGLRKVYFINLDSHPVRRSILERSLLDAKSAGDLPFERHPAVAVGSLQQCLDDPVLQQFVHRSTQFESQWTGFSWNSPQASLPPTERFLLSVYLSHVTVYDKAIREFRDDQRGYVLVLEDDVKVTEDFRDKLDAVIDAAPTDWQIIRVGTWGDKRSEDIVNPEAPLFYKASPPFLNRNPDGSEHIWYGGTHAVVVRLGTVASVIDRLTHMHVNHVDGMETSYPYLKSYAIPSGQLSDEIIVGTGHVVEASSNPQNGGAVPLKVEETSTPQVQQTPEIPVVTVGEAQPLPPSENLPPQPTITEPKSEPPAYWDASTDQVPATAENSQPTSTGALQGTTESSSGSEPQVSPQTQSPEATSSTQSNAETLSTTVTESTPTEASNTESEWAVVTPQSRTQERRRDGKVESAVVSRGQRRV